MFIETRPTPNPATVKFLPGRTVSPDGTLEFVDPDTAAEASPLAAALLAIDGVETVFLGRDFVSVSRRADADWASLKPEVLSVLVDHFLADRPVLLETAKAHASDAQADKEGTAQDSETVRQIKAVLEEKVRPAVARDGGDIVFHSYADGVVHLLMQGACSGCPSATFTLKQGIENLLRYYVPEVREVRPVES